jgi:hypothetical protein
MGNQYQVQQSSQSSVLANLQDKITPMSNLNTSPIIPFHEQD